MAPLGGIRAAAQEEIAAEIEQARRRTVVPSEPAASLRALAGSRTVNAD